MVTADYALVGGGLQNGLIALAVRARRPAARIAVIERGAALGGNHTWCFHAGDVTADQAAWLEPLVAVRWPGYDVAFPGHARRLDAPYACVTSARLAAVVGRALDAPGSRLIAGAEAIDVAADRVVYRSADGALGEIRAAVVIDARGPGAARGIERFPGAARSRIDLDPYRRDRRSSSGEADRQSRGSERFPGSACGWQVFVGRELALAAPHGLDRPIVMDATVPQIGGLRFLYVLPLAADRVLVEDTGVCDAPGLDLAAHRARIAAHVAARGWAVAEVIREERGALPLPWRCDPPRATRPLIAGYAGGWFHPVTGYSFPVAARLAQLIADCEPDALFGGALAAHARAHARQLRFAARLNRMLFHWFAPADRYRVLERFYRLPADVIARFYALASTAGDRTRILFGRPPRGLSLRGMLGLGVG